MTFRTTEEAIELANNTRYGLAASVWSENINLALHVAPQLKAGVVWVNGTNMFDAACGFGGYRESGFGREGGREGMFEYLVANAAARRGDQAGADSRATRRAGGSATARIDRTAKLFIGGKQVRPDGNYSLSPCSTARAGSPARSGSATARTFATRSRPRAPARHGPRRPPTTAARCSTSWPKTCPAAPTSSPPGWSQLTGATAEGRARTRSTLSIERLFLLCRHGRQVRGPGAPAAGPRRHAGAARAGRRGRHRRARRCAAARPDLADRAGARHGQHGGRGAVAEDIRCSPPTSTR